MQVVDFIAPDAIIPALAGATKAAVLAEMADFLASRPALARAVDAQAIYRVLAAREQEGSSGLGHGLAVPHGKFAGIAHLIGVFGRSRAGVAFDSLDGKPANFVCMLAAPTGGERVHLEALARLVRLFHDAEVRERLLAAPDGDSMYRTLVEEDAKH